ncbi:hypothetical protein MNBD_GAMMA07-2406 [hydrothermal vent metagenome]|uniref:Uncharacterized protein n=1 Tax=hydrothermal vent metagenome TaxID=652676 RepID=A0A3B0WVD0_9ZZZZ
MAVALTPVLIPPRDLWSRFVALSALGGIRLMGQNAKKQVVFPKGDVPKLNLNALFIAFLSALSCDISVKMVVSNNL